MNDALLASTISTLPVVMVGTYVAFFIAAFIAGWRYASVSDVSVSPMADSRRRVRGAEIGGYQN
jgi:hypothetical protein